MPQLQWLLQYSPLNLTNGKTSSTTARLVVLAAPHLPYKFSCRHSICCEYNCYITFPLWIGIRLYSIKCSFVKMLFKCGSSINKTIFNHTIFYA